MAKKSKLYEKKLSLSTPTISKEISFCLLSGIKVYPVNIKGKWFIESNNNGKIQTFKKEVDKNEICYFVAQTYIFYYNKLKKANESTIDNKANK